MKIKKGKLKGLELIMETNGETVEVGCPKCGWSSWQIFFIKDYSEKDIGRDCPKCGNKDLIIVGKAHVDQNVTKENILHILENPDTITKEEEDE